MKNAQAIKKFQRADGGEITVDYNAGTLVEKYAAADGSDVQTRININSITN